MINAVDILSILAGLFIWDIAKMFWRRFTVSRSEYGRSDEWDEFGLPINLTPTPTPKCKPARDVSNDRP